MAIASVNSSNTANTAAATQASARAAEAAEVQKTGRDNDGDRDDNAVRAASQAAPQPTVNLQGQKLGQVVNTLA